MVSILLSTYNGERYVKEQIESIIRQTVREWRLIIHDDGSVDSTVDIIKQYVQKDERIILVEDGFTHLGVAQSFIYLLRFVSTDFIMFCDQDDVWLENKVEIMYSAIIAKNNNIPQAIFSNAYLWNDKRGVISNRNTLTYPHKLEDLLFLNTGIQGASAIFNKKAKDLMQTPINYCAMHDHLLTLVIMTFGEIDYIDKSLMYYRQHTGNVTGNAPGSMKNKIKLLYKHSHIPVIDKKHYEGLKSFYEAFKQQIPADKRTIIEVFLSLPQKTFMQRIILIIKYRFKIFDSTMLLLAKVCVRNFC